MKAGDLVTVLPARLDLYIVISMLQDYDDLHPPREDLGALWELYSQERGMCRMHEKWIEIINER